MVVEFECVTLSTRPVAELFDLARDIDAHRQSQRQVSERAVGGVTTGRIGLGESVTWRARHFGLAMTMTSAVTELEEPTRFVDEQTEGPFRSFRHEHVFAQTASGSTMTDRVRFEAPLGVLGRIAEQLLLAPYLKRLIRDRGRFLAG